MPPSGPAGHILPTGGGEDVASLMTVKYPPRAAGRWRAAPEGGTHCWRQHRWPEPLWAAGLIIRTTSLQPTPREAWA